MKTTRTPLLSGKLLQVALLMLVAVLGAGVIPDSLVYFVCGAISFGVLLFTRYNRSVMRKLTQWAKVHPLKAQGLIALCLFGLAGLGIFNGYNLNRLGYVFSAYTPYVFGVLMAIGFSMVPFLPRRGRLILPRELERQRLAYLAIAISTLVMSAYIGNRLEARFPDAAVTRIVQDLDRAIFPSETSPGFGFDSSSPAPKPVLLSPDPTLEGNPNITLVALKRIAAPGEVLPSTAEEAMSKSSLRKARKAERKARKEIRKAERKTRKEARKEFRKEMRKIASTGGCIAAILLVVLLIGTTCAGICLIFTGTAGGIIGGPLLAAASIYAIIKVSKWCKKGVIDTRGM